MDVELLGDLLWAPVTLQEAFSLVPGDSILGFWHWGIARALGSLRIASQLLKRVVVVKLFLLLSILHANWVVVRLGE